MTDTGDDLIRRAAEHGLFDEAPEPTCIAGRYDLVAELGRGGFGAVWRARDRTLGREVAVKLLKINEREEVARFELEARVAAKLRHAHVVSVHDVGLHDGRPYLVMDLIDGKPLSALVGTLGADQLGRLLAKAARGLGAAHASGVVHRDVKPGNILVDAGGEPFVTDFGLAKPLAGESGVKTVTGAIMGTPMYMAPEQAAGDLQRISPRSDVFSLGVVLYEILAGRNPFLADNVPKILDRVQQYDPPPPSRRGKRVPVELDWVCMKALEKEPSRRYADANEFAADLERFYRGEHVTARPASLLYRAAKRVRRNPWAWGMGAAAAGLIAVAAIAGGKWRRSEEELLRARLETALRRAERDVAVIDLELATRRQDVRPLLARYDPLIVELRSILDRLPDASGYLALGNLYRRQGHYREAAAACEAGAKLAPKDTALRYEWGLALLDLARERLSRVMGLEDPILVERARLEARELADRATEEMRRAGDQYPVGRAAVACARGDLLAARNICLNQHDAGRLPVEGYVLLGETCGVLKQWDEAARWYLEALDRSRCHWVAMLKLAEVLLTNADVLDRRGENPTPILNDAVLWIERACETKPDESVHAWALATILTRRADATSARGEDPTGDLDRAIESASRAALNDPGEIMAYLHRALALEARADHEANHGRDPTEWFGRAIEDFNRCLDMNRECAQAAYGRGVTYAHWADHLTRSNLDPTELCGRAIEDFSTAISLNPEDRDARLNRAMCWMTMVRHLNRIDADPSDAVDPALDDFDWVISRDSKSAAAFSGRGTVRMEATSFRGRRGDPYEDGFAEAAADFARALEIKPDHSTTYNNRGVLYRSWGQLDAARGRDGGPHFREAYGDFQRALAIKPDLSESLNGRAFCCIHWGENEARMNRDPLPVFEKAVADFDCLESLLGPTPQILSNRATVHGRIGNAMRAAGSDPTPAFQKAVRDLETAVKLSPQDWKSYSNLGLIYESWASHAGGFQTSDGRRLARDALEALAAAVERGAPDSTKERLVRLKRLLEGAEDDE